MSTITVIKFDEPITDQGRQQIISACHGLIIEIEIIGDILYLHHEVGTTIPNWERMPKYTYRGGEKSPVLIHTAEPESFGGLSLVDWCNNIIIDQKIRRGT